MMRLPDYFETLLVDTVNLPDGSLQQLDDRVTAIYNALKADKVFGPYLIDKMPQGSWAHATIIKPPGTQEFDADVMLYLSENPEWSASPSKYIDELYGALGRNGTYAGKQVRKCRCVRVAYANSCHVDLVPYLRPPGRQVIVNRDDDDFEDTDPGAFTTWMHRQDAVASGNLRRVIRLMKFLRDHKGTFRGTRSVILTTLLGNQVSAAKAIGDSSYYGDVPSTLLHVVSDLDAWLQARPNRPSILDPSGTGLTFDHRWDDTAYGALRDRVHGYAAQIRAAFDEPDQDESVSLWQGIFGSGFHAPPVKAGSGRFGGAPPIVKPSGRGG